MVLSSHRKGEPGGGVPLRRPFALDGDPQNSRIPTRFEVDFVHGRCASPLWFRSVGRGLSVRVALRVPQGAPQDVARGRGRRIPLRSSVGRAEQDHRGPGQAEQPGCVRGRAERSRAACGRIRVFPVDPRSRRRRDWFEVHDQVWAVFDRDEHPQFKEAVELMQKQGRRRRSFRSMLRTLADFARTGLRPAGRPSCGAGGVEAVAPGIRDGRGENPGLR